MTSRPATSETVRTATAGAPSISGALAGHRNSLGLLRLVFAALVIVDHAYPLGGFGHDPMWDRTRGQASLGSIAVLGFFAISGYLITKSGMTADVVQFMWRRVLRIFPAYWLLLLVSAVLVGPVFWVLEGNALGDYWALTGGPLEYFTRNWTLEIGTYSIHDIFASTTPYGESAGSVLNGSLWSLFYEWQAYLVVAVLVAFGILTRAKLVIPGLAVFMVAVQLISITNHEALVLYIPFLGDPQRPPLLLVFLVGSTIAVYSKSIPYSHGIGVFALLVTGLTLRFGGFSVVGAIAGTYAVLYVAAMLPRRIQWIGAKNDYSYGIYIYGFLVQQILAYFGVYRLGLVPFVTIALIVAFVCAWISWHLVEKRAMSLKSWGPGRGIHFWSDYIRRRIPPVGVGITSARPGPNAAIRKEDESENR